MPELGKLEIDSYKSFLTLSPHSPPLGDLCAAQYVDGQWYRAKVERVSGTNVSVRYVDYGNKEVIQSTKCASLPTGFSQSHYAHELRLAFVKFSKDVSAERVCDRCIDFQLQNNTKLVDFT